MKTIHFAIAAVVTCSGFRRATLLLGVLLMGMSISTTEAATATWNVDANGNFSTGANWSGSTVPNTSGDDIVFGGAVVSSRTATVDAAWSATGSVNSLTLTSAANNTSLAGSGLTSFTVGAGGITNGSTGSKAFTFNSSLALTLGANQTWLTDSNGAIVASGVVSGSSTLTINSTTGSGRVSLLGNNTYSGGTILNGGTLTAGNNNAWGTGTLTINGTTNSTLRSETTTAYTMANNIVAAGNFRLGSTSSSNGALTLSGTLDLGSATRTIQVNNSATLDNTHTISGVISSATATTGLTVTSYLNGSMLSELDLTGANTYSGVTWVRGGATLGFNTISNVNGGASSLGSVTSVSDGTIQMGTLAETSFLKYIGSTAQSTDRVVNLFGTTGTTTIDSSGTGTVAFNSASTATGSGAKTLILTGTSTGMNIFNAAVNSTGGATSLVKNGNGTWKLTGASTYTGTTSVNAGTLWVDGSLASGSAVTVASGATLGGSGTVSGSVTTSGNTSVIDPNGTFTVGSLNAASGGEFKMTLGTDSLSITGAFTGSTNAGDLKLTLSGRSVGVTYTLFNFGSASGLDATDFGLSSTSSTAGYVLDTSFGSNGILVNGANVQVQFSQIAAVPEPSTYAMMVAGFLIAGMGIRRRS